MWRCTYSIWGSGGDTAMGRRHDGYLKFEIKSLGLPTNNTSTSGMNEE
jgi:hypothetical protein